MTCGLMVEQNSDEMVSIHRERYEELLSTEKMLGAMYAAGVDSWQGMEEVQNILNDEGV